MMHQKLIFTSFRNCEKFFSVERGGGDFLSELLPFFSNAHDVAREIGG